MSNSWLDKMEQKPIPIAPYPRDRGWAVRARQIVGVSLALWAFVAALAFAILRVAGWW